MNVFVEALNYDPETGLFTWKKAPRRGVRAGSVAGTLDRHGHRRIVLRGQVISAHRLAWLFVHGELPSPDGEIDHINGNRDDNRIANLRFCTHAQNQQNHSGWKKRASSSRYKGVSLYRRDQRWSAHVTLNYRKKHLGYFDTEIEAARAYDRAAVEHFGEFARLNFPNPELETAA